MRFKINFILILLSIASACFASADNSYMQYPIYAGVSVGHGSTNWSGMVDPDAESDGSDTATPVSAHDRGFVWGLLAGYEFSQDFAIQANYQHYSGSTLYFDSQESYFPLDTNPLIVNSQTESYSAIAKFMVPVFHSGFRIFADMGPAYTYRKDILADMGGWAATFGGGINHNLGSNMLGELNFNYTTGNGQSNNKPADSFMPFLYSINFVVAYRFRIGHFI